MWSTSAHRLPCNRLPLGQTCSYEAHYSFGLSRSPVDGFPLHLLPVYAYTSNLLQQTTRDRTYHLQYSKIYRL